MSAYQWGQLLLWGPALGFLHVYFNVMRQVGVTWQTLPHASQLRSAVKEDGTIRPVSFSPRRDMPSRPAKVSGRESRRGSRLGEVREIRLASYRNYSARVL